MNIFHFMYSSLWKLFICCFNCILRIDLQFELKLSFLWTCQIPLPHGDCETYCISVAKCWTSCGKGVRYGRDCAFANGTAAEAPTPAIQPANPSRTRNRIRNSLTKFRFQFGTMKGKNFWLCRQIREIFTSAVCLTARFTASEGEGREM